MKCLWLLSKTLDVLTNNKPFSNLFRYILFIKNTFDECCLYLPQSCIERNATPTVMNALTQSKLNNTGH